MLSESTQSPAHAGGKLSHFTLDTQDYFEFALKAALVPIVRGYGKTGNATTGRPRWLCRDNYEQPDALGALHGFMQHCQAHYEALSGEKLSKVQASEFIGSSVGRILDADTTCCESVYYVIRPDKRTLILYRDDNGYFAGRARESILRAVWLLESKGQGNA